MIDQLVLKPNYRVFYFDPKDDITVKELAAILKIMQIGITENLLTSDPKLFKHFKVHETDAKGKQ